MENFCSSRGIAYRHVPDQGTGHVGIIEVNLAELSAKQEGPDHDVCAGGGGTSVGWEEADGGMVSGSYQQWPTPGVVGR